MDITDQITEQTTKDVVAKLFGQGVAHLKFRASRVVVAALPDSAEIMVAMEGAGCIFIDREMQPNAFRLISAGFQIEPAQRITELLARIADWHANARDRAPAITDNRSE